MTTTNTIVIQCLPFCFGSLPWQIVDMKRLLWLIHKQLKEIKIPLQNFAEVMILYASSNDYFETVLGFKCLVELWIQMRNTYLLSNSLSVFCVWLSTRLCQNCSTTKITLFKCNCSTKVNVILSEKFCFLIYEGNSFLGSKHP